MSDTPKPPAGYDIQPAVVADPNVQYSLGNAPRFLKDTLPLDQMKVEQGDVNAMTGIGAEHRKATAYVSPKNPNNIEVLDPSTFKQAQLDHELTHTQQDRLLKNERFAPVDPENLYKGANDAAFLAKDSDPDHYSKEQWGRIVENHEQKTEDLLQKAKAGTLTQEDVDEYKKWTAAVGPLIKNLAAKTGKSYASQPAKPNEIEDLPEFSDRKATLPASLPHRQSLAPRLDSTKVVAGVFGAPTPPQGYRTATAAPAPRAANATDAWAEQH